ncbi:MAG: enoyl-CoA hydratase [Pseudomonadales bacterium]|jgi:2-(1,2-epoxy-1,2-dihydrophenyl)acetyl-CoA isomerase|nr:enoyl-CoA hydratase [Pseudomonadales bacterium]MDP6470284.1 enoyl-CoA hydratase [Pseudomonadales bacterium]MDP6827190.1 enoyl-CoA hydratase [Pseudomonadales bacterium]MDP6972507.1 enoyl-CoA hydratase [Pseudomonadales bacterium]|tara:strand:+ start:1049 stop:1858 length:810 start_codon:yes stop_codon:yes gene_type:complete
MTDCLMDKRDDGVALITLNRPDHLNAVSAELQKLLADYLRNCEQDPTVRCVALTGAGRGFCAGGDVKQQSASASDQTQPARPTFEQKVASLQKGHMQISHTLHTMAKPVVALVNGPAAGAGLSVALACDIRICSDKASFHTAFAKVGLSGDYGGSYYLQRLIGYGRAIELYFTGERVSAERALALGIANHVIGHDRFMAEGIAYCARLAAGPTRAYGNMKANFNIAERATLEDALAQEATTMIASGTTSDHREGALCFVERREPKFTGH